MKGIGLVKDGALHLGIPRLGNLIKAIHVYVTIIIRNEHSNRVSDHTNKLDFDSTLDKDI